MPHQIETYKMNYACGHSAQQQVEHWGEQPRGNQTTGALCPKCSKVRDRAHAKLERQHAAALKAIWTAAHPLRDPDQDRGSSLDLYGKPTTGRITYATAVAEYGADAVAAAMEMGRVYLDDVHGKDDAKFDPRNATPTSRLRANGVTIG